MSNPPFTPIIQALGALAEGRILILVDDEERENEGDFIFAAQHVTPEKVNFLATHGRGLICAPATLDRLRHFDLQPYPPDKNTALMGTNFTDSVDARQGVSTGISAADRAETIRVLANPASRPSDLVRPGHVFPIAANEGGVLTRAGHTEGTVDLCRLSGCEPVGVLCEILNPDGSMARLPELTELAHAHDMPLVTIKDLIAHRSRTEKLVNRLVITDLPNDFGHWKLILYEDLVKDEHHMALILGEPSEAPTLVRMHSQCFTGDTLGSLRCDCGAQLHEAMRKVAEAGRGVIIYLHQEGRGIGLHNKLMAYELQDHGLDTVEANERLGFKADLREYGIGAQILADLGLRQIRLMTNNPRKIVGLAGYNIEVIERVGLEVGRHNNNQRYLETKRSRLGHLLSGSDA